MAMSTLEAMQHELQQYREQLKEQRFKDSPMLAKHYYGAAFDTVNPGTLKPKELAFKNLLEEGMERRYKKGPNDYINLAIKTVTNTPRVATDAQKAYIDAADWLTTGKQGTRSNSINTRQQQEDLLKTRERLAAKAEKRAAKRDAAASASSATEESPQAEKQPTVDDINAMLANLEKECPGITQPKGTHTARATARKNKKGKSRG